MEMIRMDEAEIRSITILEMFFVKVESKGFLNVELKCTFKVHF